MPTYTYVCPNGCQPPIEAVHSIHQTSNYACGCCERTLVRKMYAAQVNYAGGSPSKVDAAGVIKKHNTIYTDLMAAEKRNTYLMEYGNTTDANDSQADYYSKLRASGKAKLEAERVSGNTEATLDPFTQWERAE